MNPPDYKPEFQVSDILVKAIAGVYSLASLSTQYNQEGMYFRGYLDGLQYALSVLGAVFAESEVQSNDHA